MSWPSTLGAWASCARRQWHRQFTDRPQSASVDRWVGSAVHATLADQTPSPAPAYMRYDAVTPNLTVALAQVADITSEIREKLAVWGLVPVEWEIATDEGFCPGTIDVLLMRDREPILADVKTGDSIGAGAWLQLGAYHDAYCKTFPDRPDPIRVAVIHAPRPKFGQLCACTIETRDGEVCAGHAKHWAGQADRWAEEDSWLKVPASPGTRCLTCEIRKHCEVSI